MRHAALVSIAVLVALAGPAHAEPYCDALMAFLHDAPLNAVPFTTITGRAGVETVAREALPGAHCLVSPYNPTGVAKDHPAEQSVYCFWRADEDGYRQLLDDTNIRIAGCMDQAAQGDTFVSNFEYDSNAAVVRVSADQMTNDWAISVTVMPR